ncbi:hypothetical protein JKP75_13155 [Blastococcus sp. TML/M2B]|uniref:hypothetical protein n=1 Tax=unclassified Blastococcus TaxID=2619396 RepID=UPI00190D49F2|nr:MULTISPECIES: hypothetical protein [unclassified Blastococcus]MBN1093425.1 hypothetical protein [Blastococcus sp. TML/M2B]MBN1096458.1 hypothetical protein [Blastococcus sp. TML/C7B]
MTQFRSPAKLLVAGVALTAALGLSACSDDASADDATTSSSSSESAQFARPEPVASLPAIPAGGSTAVALDAAFVDALGSLGLTPGTVGGATLADGSVSFPITGGTVTVFDKSTGYKPYVQGTLFHQGSGLSLTAGGTTVELTNFTIDPGTPSRLFGDVSVNGELAVPSAPLFDLDGSTLNPPTIEGGEATLQGTEVLLSAEAAELLNTTFDTDALAGGFLIGVATITVPTS